MKNSRIEYDRKWRAANPEKVKEKSRKWAKNNPEKAKENSKNHYEANKEKRAKQIKSWADSNPEKRKEIIKRWMKANPEKVQLKRRRRYLRIHNTPKGRISASIKGLVWRSLKAGKGGRSWESLVGYTAEALKKHLESNFKNHPGMSWENMGAWHIDHIIPVSAFHYETVEDIDFKKCWALKNLQPLWALDNIKKGGKVDKPFQPSLNIAI